MTETISQRTAPSVGGSIEATAVLESLREHLLVDGFDLVLDLDRSHGSTLVDARDGREWTDLFTFFASNPLGMNHPALFRVPVFREELTRAAINKPSNSDVYTVVLARFALVPKPGATERMIRGSVTLRPSRGGTVLTEPLQPSRPCRSSAATTA